ncbi:putative MFS-type transporter YybF [Jeotgalicoccus coquinae]|uniref:Inner membrane transport protein YnfM n=1 Tax=Jeotgalicoccus coquinae TaxID=709509 RepID=A0A6V7R2Z5_9STAP|nr:MFS transporter [Jeotgalicoccus coquinae]MBB6423453.1 YNFM family putative membrane transporter [Jeotgalicoccus coquinae]GGE19997.1 putative MFS-type transporter YybF [Jeotgalicoccus coquinae]CAD2071690.1 Inner membrane transport protein YnfM [Jeotgalicoccus coquinae]
MGFIERGTKSYRQTALAFFAAGFNTFAILYVVQPILPDLTAYYGVTPTTASLSLSVTTFTLAVSMLIFGSISEAVGRKNIMIVSMLMASILCIFTAFSPTFGSLIVMRALQGIALAGLPSIAMAYLGEEIHPRSLPGAMGLYISGNALGAVFGRVFSGVTAGLWGWQYGLIGVGIVSLIATMIFWYALSPSKHFVKREFNVRDLFKSLTEHLKNPLLIILFIMGFLLLGTNVSLYNYVSFVLIEDYNISQTIVSWVYLIFLVGVLSSMFSGNLVYRFGKVTMLYAGLSIAITGLLIVLIPSVWMIVLGLILFTFGFFIAHSLTSGWVGNIAHSNKAQASSLYLFFYYTGSSVGGTLAGVFWMQGGWLGVSLLNIGFLVLCFILFMTFLYLLKRRIWQFK